MLNIQLKVTEHPGRKSGRFTYQAIHEGQVIYETQTHRTYVAILLTEYVTAGEEVKWGASYRFGRFDLIGKGDSRHLVGVPGAGVLLARVDFVPSEELAGMGNLDHDRLKDLLMYEPRPENLDPNADVEEVLNRLAKIGKVADHVVTVMDDLGTKTWEEMEPFLTAVLDIKLRARAKELSSEHSIPSSHE